MLVAVLVAELDRVEVEEGVDVTDGSIVRVFVAVGVCDAVGLAVCVLEVDGRMHVG